MQVESSSLFAELVAMIHYQIAPMVYTVRQPPETCAKASNSGIETSSDPGPRLSGCGNLLFVKNGKTNNGMHIA